MKIKFNKNRNEMKWNIEENGNKNQYYICIINSQAVSLIVSTKKMRLNFLKYLTTHCTYILT